MANHRGTGKILSFSNEVFSNPQSDSHERGDFKNSDVTFSQIAVYEKQNKKDTAGDNRLEIR